MTQKTSIKWDLIDLLRREGYDAMTAAESVTKFLQDLRTRPPGTYNFYTKLGTRVTLRKG